MYNDKDPRSINYKRVYNKEKINYSKLFINLIVFLICTSLIYVFIESFFIVFLILYFAINLKNILLLCIKLYQKFAPISIRSKCRFEPSCSNYMLICLQKFGLIKGLIMGLNRIKRCNVNNGGFDYP